VPADAGRPPATPPVDPRPPEAVREILGRLRSAGFAAYLVGGSLRDALLGRGPTDWDVATSALPEQVRDLFPGSFYQNRFGTVLVRHAGTRSEVTTFRREYLYGDHRRPDHVEFTTSLDEDLARRDFTVNALAWSPEAPGAGGTVGPILHDPFGGRADLVAGIIRAVGDPAQRFEEDALRMLRAVRFAATLGFTIEPVTLGAIRANAGLAATLSGERLFGELRRMLAATRPSAALRPMAEAGLLGVALPEVAAQRGIPQDKVPGLDLWEHTLATVDAAPDRPAVRLAALLHDVGKPATLADGGFPGHDRAGAEMAARILRRLAVPRDQADAVVHLVRQHMFSYEPSWSGAAVRRFIRRVGAEVIDDLLDLRAADNAGSGLPAGAGRLPELRARVAAELAAGAPLRLADLAIDGDDLLRELGLAPGPEIGRLLGGLLEVVLNDPDANTAERLLAEARRSRGDAERDPVPGEPGR